MTIKIKRYDVGYDRLGDDAVTEEDGGEYVKFFYVEAFLRELIAMAEEAQRMKSDTVNGYGSATWLFGRRGALDEVADRARALLGEEKP